MVFSLKTSNIVNAKNNNKILDVIKNKGVCVIDCIDIVVKAVINPIVPYANELPITYINEKYAATDFFDIWIYRNKVWSLIKKG